jgi:hypothetical protein
MECFGTTDFDNNSRLITLTAIKISGRNCICYQHNGKDSKPFNTVCPYGVSGGCKLTGVQHRQCTVSSEVTWRQAEQKNDRWCGGEEQWSEFCLPLYVLLLLLLLLLLSKISSIGSNDVGTGTSKSCKSDTKETVKQKCPKERKCWKRTAQVIPTIIECNCEQYFA